MHFRRWFFSLFLLTFALSDSQGLRAQCLHLEQLDRGVAAGRITPDSLADLLDANEWVRHRGLNQYWTQRTLGEDETPEERAEGWVGLRRNNEQACYDLVYKTTHRACINQLRADLRRRGKLKSEPITCAQCEGERLIGDGYTVSIFNQKANYDAKRTAYPYVLVIRRNTPGGDSSAIPEASSQVLSE